MTSVPGGNLDQLADLKATGSLLDPLDEQRLRDHQLRRLRRSWLQDQIISAREPLMPKEKSWFKRINAAETRFWSKYLKFNTISEYLYHGSGFNQIPILMAKHTTTFFKWGFFFYLIPLTPVLYYFHHVKSDNLYKYSPRPPVYPGDERFTTTNANLIRDDKHANYKLKADT